MVMRMTDANGPHQYANITPPPPLNPHDERMWATLIHVGGILFHFLPALIGYLVLRDRGPFIREHTRVALNFQISLAIGYCIASVLLFIFIGALLLPALWVLNVVVSILGAVAANRGQLFTTPFAFGFIKN